MQRNLEKIAVVLLSLLMMTGSVLSAQSDSNANLICPKDAPFKYYIAYHLAIQMKGDQKNTSSAVTHNFAWQCHSSPIESQKAIEDARKKIRDYENANNKRDGFVTILTVLPIKS